MEKVIYLLWRNPNETLSALRDDLLHRLTPEIRNDRLPLRMNIRDEAVEGAFAHLFPGVAKRDGLPDAVIHLWVDSADDRFRKPMDDRIAANGRRIAAYLVTESQPTRWRDPPGDDARMPGFSQVVLLTRPPRMSHDEWIDVWFNHHSANAVRMHNSLSYIQNIVIRPLTYAAPRFDAMVEEEFPIEACTNPALLYRAADDPELLERYKTDLMASAAKMVDFDKVDVIQTGAYIWPAD